MNQDTIKFYYECMALRLSTFFPVWLFIMTVFGILHLTRHLTTPQNKWEPDDLETSNPGDKS